MPKKANTIPYADLGDEEKAHVDARIVELKTSKPPHPLNQIIVAIKSEMGVVIKQYHIYQALKKSPKIQITPPHEEEEIEPAIEEEKPFSLEELKESISWSTRKVKLKVQNSSCVFYLVKLSESKKYGTRQYEKLDEDLEVCEVASYAYTENLLFPVGTIFEGKGKLTKKEIEEEKTEKIIEKSYPSGISKGFIYTDSQGNTVLPYEIREVDVEGKSLEMKPSSLFFKDSQNEIEVSQTIDLNDALDHNVSSIYALFPAENENDSPLKDAIFDLESSDDPKFLALKFNFFASSRPYDAFLQIVEENNKEYLLMSIGRRVDTKFLGQEEFPEEVVEIDDDFALDLNI